MSKDGVYDNFTSLVAHCVDSWNQIIRELKDWKKLQEAINEDPLTHTMPGFALPD